MLRYVSAVIAAALLSGCAAEPPQGSTPYQPTAAMRAVLAERVAMNAKDRPDVSLQEARDVPSVADAADAIPNVAGLPAPSIEVAQFNTPTASGATGAIGASLYRPALAKDTPIIIYFPGGTWVTRRDVAADQTARQLASRTGWVVLSLRPRLAPEAKFPAIHDDALAAYQWARSQMASWGADPTRVVLAGAGPGANLALSTAMQIRSGMRVPMPDQLLLITPWLGTATDTRSMSENGDSRPLTRSTVRWADRKYASGHLDDPRIDLADRTDFAGLPPTTIVLAQIDPLRSGAETVAAAMRAAGVRTDVQFYPGVTYGFFGLGSSVPTAARAEDNVASSLRAGFPAPLLTSIALRSPATIRHPIRHRVRRHRRPVHTQSQ
jgi:acetyl esterase/lipase